MVLCLQIEGATLVSGAQLGRASHGGEGNIWGKPPETDVNRKMPTHSGGSVGIFSFCRKLYLCLSYIRLKSFSERLAVAIALPIC